VEGETVKEPTFEELSGGGGESMSTVIAVCTSERKGTKKEMISEGILQENYGLVGDAHADSGTHRQVSLLAVESIRKMQRLGVQVGYGDFAENITCEGIELVSLPIGTGIHLGTEVILEVTQIGKECHQKCAIYYQAGDCVMPTEGVFARVIRGGKVKTGDTIRVVEKK
jgi:MOSC domain-containing protein YiiM